MPKFSPWTSRHQANLVVALDFQLVALLSQLIGRPPAQLHCPGSGYPLPISGTFAQATLRLRCLLLRASHPSPSLCRTQNRRYSAPIPNAAKPTRAARLSVAIRQARSSMRVPVNNTNAGRPSLRLSTRLKGCASVVGAAGFVCVERTRSRLCCPSCAPTLDTGS
ncbi:MAG: hypothetical protein AAFZ49_00190 [Cyanobacteria bacterium J06659_2]